MNSVYQTDDELVGDLLDGQSSAFTTLYTRYAPSLLSLLMRLVKEQTQAEDLLQDAFLKSWLNIHRYDPAQGRLLTWLSTIAKNLALDTLRQQRRNQAAIPYLIEMTRDRECYSTASDGALQGSLTGHLAQKQRDIVELTFDQAYTRQEIADELKLPLGTVKTRYRLALQQLRGRLQEDLRQYHTGNSAGCGAPRP